MYWFSLKMQFSWMSRSHRMYFLEGPPSMGFPVWKQKKRQDLKQGWWRRFQTTQMWMGGGKKMQVTICQPPHPHVHGHNIPNLFQFWDAQQCGLRQRGASTGNMSWGGMKTWIPCPGNPSALKTNYFFRFNILLVILRYTMLTINRSNQ